MVFPGAYSLFRFYSFSSCLLAIYVALIDLVVDNLFKCFTFPPTQHTVSFGTKSPNVNQIKTVHVELKQIESHN